MFRGLTSLRQKLCSSSGQIEGAIAGLIFGLLQVQHPGTVLELLDVIKVGLLLALLGWAAVLLIIGVWLRFSVPAIAVPALIAATLIAPLVVYVNNILQLPILATLVGLLIGGVLGAILCWLCRYALGKNVRHVLP